MNNRMLNDAVKRMIRLFGLEIRIIKNGGGLEGHLKRVLDKQQIDLVLDVGANRGQFGQMLRGNGYRGDILSFEPVSSSFEMLQKTARRDDKWKTLKIALGDKADVKNMNVFDSTHFSSLLNPNEFGKARFHQIRHSHPETIEIDTLDNVLLRNKLLGNRRIFLKMDTQGYDLNVFKGAQKSLGNIFGLLSEISFIPIYDGMPDYKQALAEFEGSGLCVSGLYPVVRNSDLTMIEMDCVMVKRDFVN